jgi:beta-galactosidase
MKKIVLFLLFMSFGANAQSKNSNNLQTVRTSVFSYNWSFQKGDNISMKEFSYNDSAWRKVNTPHDWSIEDLPNQTPENTQGPFSKNSIGKAATGWTVGGTAWYRKKFKSLEEWRNKLVSIYFDGVYMNSEVYLNGTLLGNHPYGYTPFWFDLTPYLNPTGQENVIAVKVRNEGKNSRWYAGSGIYRDVFLTVTNPVHVATWGTYITTPEVIKEKASVKISTTINNEQKASNDISVVTTILDSNGTVVGNSTKKIQLKESSTLTDDQTISVMNPVLWSVDSPKLYKAVTEIKSTDKTIDRVETVFGIRTIKFDGATGFSLNGKKMILKGGCIHHDNGPLGAVSIYGAEERKVEILKKNGFNAIRTSHNPPSKALLEACDRLGMLVMDEAFDTWVRPKNPDDYNLDFNAWWQKDLNAMILRDRNHPSVIMWSIGNEIYEAPDLLGIELAGKLAKETRKLDPSRPVTEAFVYTPNYTTQPLEKYIPHADLLDVEGYNYFLEKGQPHFLRDSLTLNFYERRHKNNPEKTFVVTESLPLYALENWNKSLEAPYVIGSFKWTAFDYIGEAGLGKSRVKPITGRPELKGLIGMGMFFKDEWPIYSSGSGDFDLIGEKKQASYYQDVVWGISPIEMLVHYPIPDGSKELVATWGFPEVIKSWTWPTQVGKKMQVVVYSRSKKVQLELNGKVIDEKEIPEGSITATFDVNYQPGTLVAKGVVDEKQCSNALATTGEPAAVRLIAEKNKIKADLGELAYIKVEVIDSKGNVVPYANDFEINYTVSGNASILAVGNGNVADMSSFQKTQKKVYEGKGLIVLRSNGNAGKITVQAETNGLKKTQLEIEAN